MAVSPTSNAACTFTVSEWREKEAQSCLSECVLLSLRHGSVKGNSKSGEILSPKTQRVAEKYLWGSPEEFSQSWNLFDLLKLLHRFEHCV